KPIDFRKGHDSLAALVKNELHKDPFTGTVFVFRAKKTDRLKLLYWDGTGLVMAYKVLSDGFKASRGSRAIPGLPRQKKKRFACSLRGYGSNGAAALWSQRN